MPGEKDSLIIPGWMKKGFALALIGMIVTGSGALFVTIAKAGFQTYQDYKVTKVEVKDLKQAESDKNARLERMERKIDIMYFKIIGKLPESSE